VDDAMTKIALPLRKIAIASPCQASWDDMEGDERVRQCGLCRMNVYNLSAMSHADMEELVEATEGRRCVRFFLRPDGTVLTRDCPVGWAALKRRLAWIAGVAAVLLTLILATFLWGWAALNGDGERARWPQNVQQLLDRFLGREQPPVVMGEICVPVPAPPVNPPNAQ
jgi:hypothetical protein